MPIRIHPRLEGEKLQEAWEANLVDGAEVQLVDGSELRVAERERDGEEEAELAGGALPREELPGKSWAIFGTPG